MFDTRRPAAGFRGRVVIIGPGRIGCGYLASVFAAAGWHVVLAARTPEVAARIQGADHFTVRITGDGGVQQVRAEGVAFGTEAFERAVRDADLLATAVGSRAVEGLGEQLTHALATRPADRPIDVWAVENANVASVLDAAVRRTAAREGLGLPPVGFAGAIAFAAVSHGDWKQSRRPEFVSDTGRWLLVDAERLVCPLPPLPRIGATRRYEEHLTAKRLVFSAGHALCAYLGARRGHQWVDEAATDPLLRPLIQRAMRESRRALVGAHPDSGGALEGPVEWALERYANAELHDPVRRVARDPMRKLGPEGPLVGAARWVSRTTGEVPSGLAAGIAAALVYRDPADAQAVQLAAMLAKHGVAAVLAEVCGIDRADPLADEIIRQYQRLVGSGPHQREVEVGLAGWLTQPPTGPRSACTARPCGRAPADGGHGACSSALPG
jgi:mannitol-1-phosphate 5-dehydrogenase